jgi:hypothetical protein
MATKFERNRIGGDETIKWRTCMRDVTGFESADAIRGWKYRRARSPE